MNIKFRDMRRTLTGKLGFTKTERKQHEWYELLDNSGRSIVTTLLSRQARGRNIYQPLLGKIAKQLHLNNAQLKSAVECPLTREEYYAILRAEGLADMDLQ